MSSPSLLLVGLSMVGSPAQWGVLLFVVLLVFAPRLLPVLGRLAGRSLGEWIRVSLGIPAHRRTAPRRVEVVDEPEVEVIRPRKREHTLRAGSHTSLAGGRRPGRPAPVWSVVAVVSLSVAVLLWIVLHAR